MLVRRFHRRIQCLVHLAQYVEIERLQKLGVLRDASERQDQVARADVSSPHAWS